MGMHIKKGDTVLVIAGKDKGKTGKIISCDPTEHTAKVDGINVVTKHSKPRGRDVPGGIRKMAGNVDSSNLMVVCPVCGKASRVGHRKLDSGAKIRVCKKCDGSLETGKDKKKKTGKKSDKASKADKAAKTDKAKKGDEARAE